MNTVTFKKYGMFVCVLNRKVIRDLCTIKSLSHSCARTIITIVREPACNLNNQSL